jgi:hypothetical protein
MAGKIKAIIAAQFEDSGLKKAQKGFNSLGKTIKGALGAVGLGVGVSQLVGQLNAAGKAAAQDAKSQGLLAIALKNTANATDLQIAAVETSISKMESMSAVADDNIRPAFAQLARVTGDVGKATELTSLALDVAAGTGRDLGSVSIALGKAFQGNTASLARLGVNVKGVKDPLAALATQFAGAAEAAADLDPYQRLEIVYGNIQEAVGRALLPSLNDLADYLNGDEFQTGVANVTDDLTDLVAGFQFLATQLADSVADIKNTFDDFFAIFNFGKNNESAGLLFLGDFIFRGIKALGNLKRAQEEALSFNPGRPRTGGYKAPAKVGIDLGLGDGKGGSTGLTAAQKAAAAATKAAAEAVKKATDAANEQAEAYIKAAESAADLMSATRKMVTEFADLFKVTPELGAFEQTAVDAFSNIFDTIDAALADGQILSGAANALREYAANERKVLQAIAKQRDVLAGKIDVARSITSGVMGLVGITNLLETTSKSVTETVSTIINGIQVATTKTFDVVSSGGLVDNFQKLVDKTKLFAKNLIDLKKLGLNKQLFAQLVNAGADAGGATAEALVAGGADTISALNSLYNELALSAGDIAATATDTLYEVGQQVVSNGFIEGLLSQESELQRAAQTLADSFASTFTTQLQLAVDAVLPQGSSMIDQVAAVNLGGSGVGGRSIALNAASSGRATIFNVNVSAGVVTDPNGLARTVIDSVKKYERANGSVWVAA